MHDTSSNLEQIVERVRQHYPLPLAFELDQLESTDPQRWKLRCTRLRTLIWFSFRYLTATVLSNYLRMDELSIGSHAWNPENLQARQGIRELIDQAIQADDVTMARLQEAVQVSRRQRWSVLHLHQVLDERFGREDLRTLCLYLEVDYDDLPGEGQEAKARELIKYLERQRRIHELATTILERRPDISRQELLDTQEENSAQEKRLLSTYDGPSMLEQPGDLRRWWQVVEKVIDFWQVYAVSDYALLSQHLPMERDAKPFIMSKIIAWFEPHKASADELIAWYAHYINVDDSDLRQLQGYFEEVYDRTLTFLDSLSLLQEFPLIRVREPRRGQARAGKQQWEALQYMGRDLLPKRVILWWGEGRSFPQEYIDKLAIVDGATMEPPLLLLHPMALFHLPSAVLSHEEIYIFNDLIESGTKLRYRCLRDEGLRPTLVTLEKYVEALQKLLERSTAPKKVEVSDWGEARKTAARITIPNRESLAEGKYDQAHYLEREAIVGQLNQFRQASNPGLIIVGDAGVGKTSLLCHWSGQLLRDAEVMVLLYDSRDFHSPDRPPEQLGDVIAEDLGFADAADGKGGDPAQTAFERLLKRIAAVRQDNDQRQVLLLFDALNENSEADHLLRGIINQVAKPDTPSWLKVVVTCRTEPWERAIRFAKGVDLSHFYTAGEGGEIVPLSQFDDQEVQQAYEETYGLQPRFEELSPPTQRLFADPLMLNLAYQVYGQEGKELPPALHQNQLLGQYVDRLLIQEPRDQFEEKLDLLRRLLRLMYKLRKAELTLEEAERDTEVEKVFRQKGDLPDSPYIQLLSALLREYPLKEIKTITFRVERVFEFTLARHVLQEEAQAAGWSPQWIEDILRASQTFPNLWGATRVLLIDYLETQSLDYAIIEKLARYPRYEVGRMLADVLIILVGQHEQRVREVVLRLIQESKSEEDAGGLHKGEVAITVARRFDWTQVFEIGASSEIPAVRLASVRAAYYMWRRDREEGVQFIVRLAYLARREVLTAIPKLAATGVGGWIRGRLLGRRDADDQDQLLGSLQMPESFLNISSLMLAHCLREPDTTQDLHRVWAPLLDLLDRLKRLKLPVDRILQTLGVALVVRGTGGTSHGGGGVMAFEGYAYFTHRPLDDPLRQEALRCLDECAYSPVPYQTHFFQRKDALQSLPPKECQKGSLKPFLDDFVEFMKEIDSYTHFVSGAMFLARAHLYPDDVLAVCERLEGEGGDPKNLWARYQITHKLGVYLYVDPDPPEEHFEFMRRHTLWIWRDSVKYMRIPTYNEREDKVGEKRDLVHSLRYPLMHECRPGKRTRGRLKFVDELLNQPFDRPLEREIQVIANLGEAAVFGHIAHHVNVIPILDTLQGWFNVEKDEGLSAEENERVLRELAKALTRIQTFYPDEVERYLDHAPAGLREHVAREREQPMYAIVFTAWQTAIPWLWEQRGFREGMLQAMREMARDATSFRDAAEAIARNVFNLENVKTMLGGMETR